jgi:RNA polymerase sigma-70 factor (ECF subfamily)
MTAQQEQALGIVRERIVGFLASRIGRDSAEDLAQEVVIVLMEKYAEIDRIEDLLPLSVQIAKFKMMSRGRKERRAGIEGAVQVDELQIADGRVDHAEELIRRQKTDRLMAAVAKLGDRCRELFRLKLEGKDYEEIKGIMGARSMGAVYTWDHRCRQQISEYLGGKL